MDHNGAVEPVVGLPLVAIFQQQLRAS